jgi:hypothetical protein
MADLGDLYQPALTLTHPANVKAMNDQWLVGFGVCQVFGGLVLRGFCGERR